ncbi:NADH dehydrogenase [ubiquinone] 1 alpha subcomplex subunit 8-B isoform X1 [Manihot esculenta]|uniref:NADH dehydrogenase [ubiquinone] 1 alpha subcomplex subunit 8-B isoform X1 n=1 Tax=Manihot esculenta TaxID=3983 RepID=UPI001CC63598|nr:NADH dehydrogenase [ubiquinone] 1 alpha subcomplex subunit 8-B isoform X1 [Manihot esculenta]
MASAIDATGNPIPTSAVLTASSKHISTRCLQENVSFLKCKKKDANPEKCLDKGQEVTRCVLGLYFPTFLGLFPEFLLVVSSQGPWACVSINPWAACWIAINLSHLSWPFCDAPYG